MPKDLRFTSLQNFRLVATPACIRRHLITFNSYMVLDRRNCMDISFGLCSVEEGPILCIKAILFWKIEFFKLKLQYILGH